MRAIDFFCGGGGMTRGLLNAGIDVIFGLDSNPLCQDTYERNNHIPYLNRDILSVDAEDLLQQYPCLQDNNELLMVGCAPCQPFSVLNPNNPNEHRAVNLLLEFGRIVQGIRPAHILIENVPGLKGRGEDVLTEFINILEAEGYFVVHRTINAKDYGVPQNRRRFILIASRLFQPIIPEPTHGNGLLPYRTVFDAIHHYPELEAGENNDFIPNHRAAGLSDLNIQRLRATPLNGGSRTDWPRELWLDCHTKFTGHSD